MPNSAFIESQGKAFTESPGKARNSTSIVRVATRFTSAVKVVAPFPAICTRPTGHESEIVEYQNGLRRWYNRHYRVTNVSTTYEVIEGVTGDAMNPNYSYTNTGGPTQFNDPIYDGSCPASLDLYHEVGIGFDILIERLEEWPYVAQTSFLRAMVNGEDFSFLWSHFAQGAFSRDSDTFLPSTPAPIGDLAVIQRPANLTDFGTLRTPNTGVYDHYINNVINGPGSTGPENWIIASTGYIPITTGVENIPPAMRISRAQVMFDSVTKYCILEGIQCHTGFGGQAFAFKTVVESAFSTPFVPIEVPPPSWDGFNIFSEGGAEFIQNGGGCFIVVGRTATEHLALVQATGATVFRI